MDGQGAQQSIAGEWRRSAGRGLLQTTDGRWALVSTSLTALIAGSIVCLALNTMPPGARGLEAGNQNFFPYRVFMDLAKGGNGVSFAAFGPAGLVREKSPAALSPAPAALDNALVTEKSDKAAADIDTRTITLDRGDTLAGALEDAGVSNADANAVVTALAKVHDLRSLKAGQSFDLSFAGDGTPAVQTGNTISAGGVDDDSGDFSGAEPESGVPAGQLLSLHFSPSIEHDITVTRDASGAYTAADTVKQLQMRIHRAGATIDSSLYLAAMRAGIPAQVVVEMIHMFSYKVDFQRDLKPGDSFQVFYDYYYTPDGQPAKEGNIRYAEMTLGGRQIALYRYQPDPDEPADYFDAKGQSAKGMLMKTPVDGARITSGFGMRFHPILGYTRMHKGVDFGVPIGTPVMAAGSGTVEFMGWARGYGNFVLLNHGNGYETAYGHLSRFAPGLHRGSHVRQAQTIAYSGMTGMATGPHLHYEIRINHKQVNPLTVKVATGRKLQGRELRKFLAERLHVDAEMAGMTLETRVADLSTGLRQTK